MPRFCAQRDKERSRSARRADQGTLPGRPTDGCAERLLTVGSIGEVLNDPDTAAELIEALMERDGPEREALTGECAVLAARCCIDHFRVPRATLERVITRLLDLVEYVGTEAQVTALDDLCIVFDRHRPTPGLIARLSTLHSHPERRVRMAAARLLASSASTRPEALAPLRRFVEDEDSDVRCHAALGLISTGEISPALIEAASTHRSNNTKISDERRSRLLPRALIAPLTHDDAGVRWQAAEVLGGFGPEHLWEAWLTTPCRQIQDLSVAERRVLARVLTSESPQNSE